MIKKIEINSSDKISPKLKVPMFSYVKNNLKETHL